MAEKTNLYDDGYITTYPEGDFSLDRVPQVVDFDLDDAIHTIEQGETLMLIAHRRYGTSRKWWVIADANGLDDIFNLNIGDDLIIPNLKKIK